MRRQGIYWMCQNPQYVHEKKASLLADIDYDVSIVESHDALRQNIKSKRVSIIIIGDEGDPDEVIRCISESAKMPEIHGARLILSISNESSESILKMAALQGFRDIIHLYWDDHTWLERFEFSTASQESSLENTSRAVRSSQNVTFYIPARVTWIDKNRMWVESKARPNPHDEINITGSFCTALRKDFLPLKIENTETKSLFFRFSEALITNWRHQNDDDLSDQLIEEIAKLDYPQKPRVFVAVQSPALRSTILRYLDQSEFEVHTALQKKSLVKEPEYFSPHLVFIEDRLCTGEAMSRFLAMSRGLPESSTIIIIGGDDDLNRYRNFSAGRKLESLSRIPKNLKDIVKKQYLAASGYSPDKDRFRVPQEHDYSMAEIEVNSQAKYLAADRIEIDLPFPVSNFGIIRFKNRLLTNITGLDSIYGKMVGVRKRRSGAEVATIKFSNLSTEQQEKLRRYLDDNYKS